MIVCLLQYNFHLKLVGENGVAGYGVAYAAGDECGGSNDEWDI